MPPPNKPPIEEWWRLLQEWKILDVVLNVFNYYFGGAFMLLIVLGIGTIVYIRTRNMLTTSVVLIVLSLAFLPLMPWFGWQLITLLVVLGFAGALYAWFRR